MIVDGAGLGLNHGIAFYGGYLYASNPTTVFRWPYTPGSFQLLNQNTRQTVIQGIPSVQGHSTRTLAFDRQGSILRKFRNEQKMTYGFFIPCFTR